MKCPECQKEMPEEARFCSNCGAKLPRGTSIEVQQEIGTVSGEVVGSILGDDDLPGGLDSNTVQKIDSVGAGGSVVGTIVGGGGEVHVGGQHVETVQNIQEVDTGGGAYIGGSVDTEGGGFTGRDQQISATGPGSVAIGGGVQGSTIVTGSGNVAGATIEQPFAAIYQAIEQHPRLGPQDKQDLKSDTEDVEAELKKGDEADESFLERRLRSIQRMAPDILDVIIATLANPAAGLGMVAKKVAEKMKAAAG